ncbi:MAG TPA: winged helix DNA-binding domain-containing protein [Cyclobacteriaceae bacterium]|nr:winged helix DNA-binding domain-containing protein [Cyclobacteriaceae bacterium]
MKPDNISIYRIINQHILGNRLKTVKEIARWMGAMQAQDYEMVKWALGIRLPGSGEQDIEIAIRRGDIIRTHVLRPTWHIVSAEDARWMIRLTAPHIHAGMKSRHKQLEITGAVLTKSNRIIEKILASGEYASRDELVAGFEKAGLPNTDNRAAHLLVCAELDMLICSGPSHGKKATYALFDKRVPESKPLLREEALAKLAGRYFSSHGPATLKDFTWWSGLPATDARQGLESAKSGLYSEKSGDETYWFKGSLTAPLKKSFPALLLPGYDEFIISYKDRSAVIPTEKFRQAISSNGIFWPVILVDGKAAGMWKRAIKNEKLIITLDLFSGNHQLSGKTIKKQFEKSAGSYGNFLRLETELIIIAK